MNKLRLSDCQTPGLDLLGFADWPIGPFCFWLIHLARTAAKDVYLYLLLGFYNLKISTSLRTLIKSEALWEIFISRCKPFDISFSSTKGPDRANLPGVRTPCSLYFFINILIYVRLQIKESSVVQIFDLKTNWISKSVFFSLLRHTFYKLPGYLSLRNKLLKRVNKLVLGQFWVSQKDAFLYPLRHLSYPRHFFFFFLFLNKWRHHCILIFFSLQASDWRHGGQKESPFHFQEPRWAAPSSTVNANVRNTLS